MSKPQCLRLPQRRYGVGVGEITGVEFRGGVGVRVGVPVGGWGTVVKEGEGLGTSVGVAVVVLVGVPVGS